MTEVLLAFHLTSPSIVARLTKKLNTAWQLKRAIHMDPVGSDQIVDEYIEEEDRELLERFVRFWEQFHAGMQGGYR